MDPAAWRLKARVRVSEAMPTDGHEIWNMIQSLNWTHGKNDFQDRMSVVWLMPSKSWYDLLIWPLSSWWPMLVGLVGVVVVISLIVRLVARVNEDTDPAEADRDMLLTLTELRREGDLTQEEFRSIKSRLVQRIVSADPVGDGNRQPAKSAEFSAASESETGKNLTEASAGSDGPETIERNSATRVTDVTGHAGDQKYDQ